MKYTKKVIFYFVLFMLFYPLFSLNSFFPMNHNFYLQISRFTKLGESSLFSNLEHVEYVPIDIEIFIANKNEKIKVWRNEGGFSLVGIMRDNQYVNVFSILGFKDNFRHLGSVENISRWPDLISPIRLTTNVRDLKFKFGEEIFDFYEAEAKYYCSKMFFERIYFDYELKLQNIKTNLVSSVSGRFIELDCSFYHERLE